MRKVFINFVSAFVAVSIALVLIISLASCQKDEENKVSLYAINYDESRLVLGNTAVKSVENPKKDDDVLTAEVESGVDFYNNVIKTNEYYNSSIDFKKAGYVAYGYMWKDLCLYHYEVKGNTVNFKSSFGWTRKHAGGGGYQTRLYVIPGPFEMLIDEGEEVETEEDYKRCTSPTDDLTFEELVKIYQAGDKSFYEVEGNSLLIKAKYYPGYDKTVLEVTEKYFCEVINETEKVSVFKIKY